MFLAPENPTTPPVDLLTERECQIMRLISMGLSNAKIADALCLSMHTAKNHKENIKQKLNLDSKKASHMKKIPKLLLKNLGKSRVYYSKQPFQFTLSKINKEHFLTSCNALAFYLVTVA
jgi:DNA-binding CsgD family transcriptional regulator